MNGTGEPIAPAPPDASSAEPGIGPEPAPPVSGPATTPRKVSYLDLLVNPRAFFDALGARPVSLGAPALIVIATGLVAAIAAYLVSSIVIRAINIPGVQGYSGVAGTIGGLSALIVTVLVWVILTAVFFAISMAFKGRGDFNRLLAYVGWGHLPQVIGGIISLALTWSYLTNLRVPSLTDPQAIQAFTTALTRDPTYRLSVLVSLIFLLWSANIWIFGVRAGRKLSTRDAAISVLVPVLIYILIAIVPTLVS